MVELERTFDPVRLSLVRSLLADADIDCAVFDMGSIWQGAIPTRLMVADQDLELARRVLRLAGISEPRP